MGHSFQKRKNVDPYFVLYTKSNLKWFINLNGRANNKTSRRKCRKNVWDLGVDQWLLENKRLTAWKKKLDPTKIQNCYSKDIVKNDKTSHRRRANICKTHLMKVCILNGGDVLLKGTKTGSWGAKKILNMTFKCGPPKSHRAKTDIQYVMVLNFIVGDGIRKKTSKRGSLVLAGRI